MPHIDNADKKKVVADTIKILVSQINDEIELANKLRLDVKFVQNEKRGTENAHLCYFVGETISY